MLLSHPSDPDESHANSVVCPLSIPYEWAIWESKTRRARGHGFRKISAVHFETVHPPLLKESEITNKIIYDTKLPNVSHFLRGATLAVARPLGCRFTENSSSGSCNWE
jgi:hypothetical protein